MSTVLSEQIQQALRGRMARFKAMLSRLADGEQVDAGEILDLALAAKIDPDSIPERVALVVRRRRLKVASQVPAEITAERDQLTEAISALDEAEQERLREAETARRRYELNRQNLTAKVNALKPHFQAADSASSKLADAIDPALRERLDALKKQRQDLVGLRHRMIAEAENLKQAKRPDWQYLPLERQAADAEQQIATIDADLAQVRQEADEIL